MISVTRRPTGLDNPKLKEIIVPHFSNLLEYRDDLFGDIYFCALGTTIKVAGSKDNFKRIDYDAIVNFGKIAKSHMAKSLTVISASMADPNSKMFYNRIKGETEQALISMNLNRLTLFRPGLLIGERSKKRSGEEFAINMIKVLSPILSSKLKKAMATDIETLAMSMLEEGKKSIPELKIINAKDI